MDNNKTGYIQLAVVVVRVNAKHAGGKKNERFKTIFQDCLYKSTSNN